MKFLCPVTYRWRLASLFPFRHCIIFVVLHFQRSDYCLFGRRIARVRPLQDRVRHSRRTVEAISGHGGSIPIIFIDGKSSSKCIQKSDDADDTQLSYDSAFVRWWPVVYIFILKQSTVWIFKKGTFVVVSRASSWSSDRGKKSLPLFLSSPDERFLSLCFVSGAKLMERQQKAGGKLDKKGEPSEKKLSSACLFSPIDHYILTSLYSVAVIRFK